MEEAVRKTWHCGWMEESEWTKLELPPRFSENEPYNLEICPGWLVRQDPVIESTRAYSAYDKGVLDTVFPDPPNGLIEGAEVMSASFNAYSAHKTRESVRKR